MRPLEGITVLDFTQAYNGPYCAMNLADNGARVIKVERVAGGDQSRYWGPHPAKEIREKLLDNGSSGYYAVYNRNKESIAVDLGEDEGKKLIKKLYKEVDVVLENFKFGTIDKLGVGYDVAKEINPEIIFVSASGYGQNGPLCRNTAYDNVIECMSGYMEMNGYPDRLPLRSGASVGDSYTGLTAFFGVVLACYRKKMTGKGSKVDVAMLDTMFAANEGGVLPYSLTGIPATRTINAKPNEIVPYDTYDCADDSIAVGISEEEQWPGFCKAIDMPELTEDPRFATNDLRCSNFDEFNSIVKEAFKGKSKAEMLDNFAKHKVPASEMLIPLQALDNEHLKSRGMVLTLDDANVGSYKCFGIPIKYSKTPGEVRKTSPLLGENTCDVMKSVGYTQEEIDRMIAEEIVGTPESTEQYFGDDDE